MNKNENIRLFPSKVVTQSESVISQELKLITASDTFPCYSCFDEPASRINCEVCNKLGYITGENPMVKFVDDFLSKNLSKYLVGQSQTTADDHIKKSQQNSQSSDQQKNMFIGNRNLINRKQCRSALQSYRAQQQQSSSLVSSNLMKSSNPTTKQQIHLNYQCNFCESGHIRGKRYHCQECQDYDLCERCYSKGAISDDHKPNHKMQAICAFKPELIVSNLKKSTLNRNKR